MKTLKYTNANQALDVEYLVDLIGDNDMLTVYDIHQYVDGVKQEGLNGDAYFLEMFDKDEQVVNANNSRTKHTLTRFVAKAVSENLDLNVYEDGEDVESLNSLTDLDITDETLDAGVSGVAQLDVVTFPAQSGATQGDYVVLVNALTEESAAIWLDIDDDGTEPTGDKYVAADYQIKVGIATGDTAAEVAAKAVTAIEASAWENEVTLTDNADGSVDFQQDYSGDIANPDPENADDSGVGSITTTTSTEGTDGTAYEQELEAEGGNEPYVWITEDTLPEGITLSTAGVLSGVPRETGTFTVTITLTDFFGVTVDLEDVDLVVSETE